ncbi:MAG: FtsQ-type POTRA domain-containing protein [Clostridia bacterium]|nr:FtsQ-type POTRA domain-containing protein [Clostridia bacterium]
MNTVNDNSSNPSPQPEHRRLSRYILAVVAALLLLLVIWGICTVVGAFATVGKIVVKGESPYAEDRIIAVSGIETGMRKNKINAEVAETEILNNLPCISEVNIRKKLGGVIEIRITSENVRYLTSIADDYYVVSDSFRLLGLSGTVAANDSIVMISLPFVKRAIVGQRIEYYEDTEYIGEFVSVLEDSELDGGIDSIDVSDKYKLEVLYDGKYTIRIGELKNMDEKLRMIYLMLEDEVLSEGIAAIFDVSDISKPTIQPIR